MHKLAWLGLLVSALGVGACGDDNVSKGDAGVKDAALDAAADAGENPMVTRGRYLVNNVALCSFCHTPLNPDGTRDMTRFLSGFECFIGTDLTTGDAGVGEPGCLSSRNLTNDPTGLMNRTNAEIKAVFRMGMRTDGKVIAPVMPTYVFSNMTDADLDSIIAYLRTVPGVHHVVPPNQPPWDAIPAPAVAIDPATIPMPQSSYPDQAAAMRGRYLATEAGLCIDCHTKQLPQAPPPIRPIDMGHPMQGGLVFPSLELGLPSPPYPAMITSRNLTPDATGLLGYDVAGIVKVLKMGIDRTGMGVCAATHGGPSSGYAGLTDADAMDIANYLLSMAPVVNDTSPDCKGPVP